MHLDINQLNQPKCWLLERSDVAGPEFLRFKFCSVEDQVSVAITCRAAFEIFRNIARAGNTSYLTSSEECAALIPNRSSNQNQMIKTHLFLKKLGIPWAFLQFNELKKLYISDYGTSNSSRFVSQFEKTLSKTKKLPSLKTLDISDLCSLASVELALELIEKTPNLTDLNINFSLLNILEIFECLRNNPSLTMLSLKGDHLSGTMRGGFRFLKSLTIVFTKLSSNWVENFAKETKLETLRVYQSEIPTLGFQSLLSSNLKRLTLSDFTPFDETYSELIVKHAPNLEVCDLQLNNNNIQISNALLAPFLNAEKLKILSVTAKHFASDLSIELVNELALKFKNAIDAQILDFDDCEFILESESEKSFEDKFNSFCLGEIPFITFNIEKNVKENADEYSEEYDEEDEVEDEVEDEEEMKI